MHNDAIGVRRYCELDAMPHYASLGRKFNRARVALVAAYKRPC